MPGRASRSIGNSVRVLFQNHDFVSEIRRLPPACDTANNGNVRPLCFGDPRRISLACGTRNGSLQSAMQAYDSRDDILQFQLLYHDWPPYPMNWLFLEAVYSHRLLLGASRGCDRSHG